MVHTTGDRVGSVIVASIFVSYTCSTQLEKE